MNAETKRGDDRHYTVSTDVYWRYDPAPKNTKIFILNPGGVAIIGEWDAKAGYLGWHPLFKRDMEKEKEQKMRESNHRRVTPEDIESNITSEHYFTALEGVVGAGYSEIHPSDSQPLSLLTFCVLVLENGFTVTGESACVSPEAFDAEIGKKVARANAIAKVWPLLGYVLKTKLQREVD